LYLEFCRESKIIKKTNSQKHTTEGLKTQPYKRVNKKWEVQQDSDEDQEEEAYSIGIERKPTEKLLEFALGTEFPM
tara:strand:- start:690 stop:917 length:228 start_codon:yes stop_codon:yes gene_type:complete